MPPSMEPIESFAYLVDNIPQWLTKVDELNTRCNEQYDRFYKLTKHGEVKLTRKKKNDSTESLRPKDTTTVPFLQIDNAKGPLPTPAIAASHAVADPGPTPHSDSAVQFPTSTPRTLKRKPDSALSAASGKDGYRTKSMIVVYYDSAIQEGFENIVKQVSNARSNLRKGRTTATFQTRMASMGLPSVNNDETLPSAKFMMPSIGRTKESAIEKQKFKIYDESDRHLEEAQNLSERAAHQFLRDGDCNVEIEAIKRRVKTVQQLASEELERLRNEKASSEQSEPLPPSNGKGIEQILDRVYPRLPTPPLLTKPVEANTQPPKPIHFVATGAIEVDDASSDSSSIRIDMNAVRRVTRRVL